MKKSLKYKKKTHKKNSKNFRKTLKYKKNSKQFHKKTHKKYYKKYLGGMRVRNISTNEVRDEEDDYTLQDGEEEVDRCTVCYEDDTPKNPLVILHTPAGNASPHKFHVGCIGATREWKERPHRGPVKCPNCRELVRDGPLIEQLRAQAQAKRKAAEDAERQRKAAENAERQRKAAEDAERERKVKQMPPLIIDLHPISEDPIVAELIHACMYGDIRRAEELIQQGVDVNAKDRKGWTALMHSCDTSYVANNFSCIEMLIANGADVNAKANNSGFTALMFASRKGHVGAIEMLIANGADVNARNNIGHTALMSASIEGHVGAIEMLIANGADVNATDNIGNTAIMLAQQQHREDAIRVLEQNGAVKDDLYSTLSPRPLG